MDYPNRESFYLFLLKKVEGWNRCWENAGIYVPYGFQNTAKVLCDEGYFTPVYDGNGEIWILDWTKKGLEVLKYPTE